MKAGTVLLSGGVHLAAFALFVFMANEKELRKATSVVVVDQKTEKKKEKPPEPKPPPPAPKHVAPKVQPTAMPEPTPVAASVPTPAAAPVDSSFQMSNSGPGLEVGTGPAKAEQKSEHPAAQRPAAAKPPPPPPSSAAAAECTEAPSKPVPVVKTNPEYTDAARAAGIEGRLVVRIYVGADGSVEKIEVVTSVDPALDAAAIATIQKWRFTPSMKCGKAVEGGVFVFAQRFELAGD